MNLKQTDGTLTEIIKLMKNYNFSLYWLTRKGIGALAPSMRECAQKLQQGKRICIVGQVPISTNQ